MRSQLIVLLGFTGLLLASTLSHAVPATNISGSLSYNHDNNLTLGYLKPDILGDSYITAGADVRYTQSINPTHQLQFNLTPSFTTFSKYDGLNHSQLDAKISYVFQFSKQFRSPQFSLFYLLGQSDYKSDLRDNTHHQAGLTVRFRFDDRTLLSAGFSTASSDADATFDPGTSNTYQTFDTDREISYFAINAQATTKLSIYASLSQIKGDVVVNWRDSTFAAIPLSTVIAWETIPDTVFANNWSSSKYHANITKIAVGFNYVLNQNNALDVVFEDFDADAGNYSYAVQRYSINYLHRF